MPILQLLTYPNVFFAKFSFFSHCICLRGCVSYILIHSRHFSVDLTYSSVFCDFSFRTILVLVYRSNFFSRCFFVFNFASVVRQLLHQVDAFLGILLLQFCFFCSAFFPSCLCLDDFSSVSFPLTFVAHLSG